MRLSVAAGERPARQASSTLGRSASRWSSSRRRTSVSSSLCVITRKNISSSNQTAGSIGRMCHLGGMNRSALAALTAAGLMFGLTVPLSKLALGWLDPTWLAAARFGLAAPVLALLARRTLRAAATRPVAAWGAVGYGAMVVLQNLGVERTSVTHAALIFGAVPVLVAAGSALSGRAAPGPGAWAGFGVALGGVAVVAGWAAFRGALGRATPVAGSGGEASLFADGLVLASAVLGSPWALVQCPAI